MKRIITVLMIIALLMTAIAGCDETPAPKADFRADITSGPASLKVRFYSDNSTGEISDYLWDFNGDEIIDSTMKSPSYTYNTPGEYSVSLKVVGPGGSDTEFETDYITVTEEEEEDDGETEADGSWILATTTREGELRTDVIRKFVELVEEKTEGQIEITVYLQGEYYDTMEQVTAGVMGGSIDCGLSASSYFSGTMPKNAGAIAAPQLLIDDLELLAEVLHDIVEDVDTVKAEAEANNVMHAVWVAGGQGGFYFADPTPDIEAMAGKRVASGGGTAVRLNDMLDMTSSVMDATDFYAAIDGDQVDGTGFLPIDYYISLHIYEVAPYALIPTLWTLQGIIINQDSFDALDAALQDAVLEAAAEAEAWGITQFLAAATAQLDSLTTEYGCTVYMGDRDEWNEKVFEPAAHGALLQAFNYYVGLPTPPSMVEILEIVAEALAP
ncbi:TRAP transporter substrate-binding protein DctP [Chloroflexota bacterium]